MEHRGYYPQARGLKIIQGGGASSSRNPMKVKEAGIGGTVVGEKFAEW